VGSAGRGGGNGGSSAIVLSDAAAPSANAASIGAALRAFGIEYTLTLIPRCPPAKAGP
jgi:hypothetical protein